MIFTRDVVEDFLQYYELRKLNTITPLESGFESDNVKVITNSGKFVMRVLYQSPDRVNDIMKVYDTLVLNGIKTARPIKTKKNSYCIKINSTESLVIQKFVEGQPYFREFLAANSELYQKMLKLYGEELGKLHSISSKAFDKIKFKELDPKSSTIKNILNLNPAFLRLPDEPYVISEYEKWKIEAKSVIDQQLSFGITHDDIKPGDFFLVNDGLSGILDFNAARFDFLLSDLSAFIMYCGMYLIEDKSRFSNFIESYMETSCILPDELKQLQFFFKTRALLQILYFSYRIKTQTLQGVNSQDDNYTGYKDGIKLLKAANKLPHTYFHDLVYKKI